MRHSLEAVDFLDTSALADVTIVTRQQLERYPDLVARAVLLKIDI